MYSVALVQNQSEMSHYGYADARPLLRDYRCRMFTGDDIAALAPALESGAVDALVLGTNAINDRDIMRELRTPEFAAVLGSFLESGRGFVCLQQLGLAMRNGPTLGILPEPLGSIRPRTRPAGESARSPATLGVTAGAPAHVVLTYPAVVDPAAVQHRALNFRSLPGLYWHYWDDVDLRYWDQVLSDVAHPGHRSLVLAAKESGPCRVVVSALPLDWQAHVGAFSNILSYAVEGRHNLALFETAENDLAFDYVRQSLRTRRIPFGEYLLAGDDAGAAANLAAGVHSTVLIGPGLRLESLPQPLAAELRRGVDASRLRIIELADRGFGTRKVSLVSRELRPRRLLHVTELQIQEELREGYIDDSFWSHVETLQTVDRMPDRIVDYAALQEPAFRITRNHDRNDSYDEVFGPTCAFYWMRARFLGADSPEATRTARWLREQLAGHDPHERALAYLMFGIVGTLLPAELDDLATTVRTLDIPAMAETEQLLFLRAAVAARAPVDVLAELAGALTDRQRDGVWLDLTTTASAATALLGAHADLTGDAHRALRSRVERSVLDAVTHILTVLARAQVRPESHPYPWDGKARTTTKCLQAWFAFDALQDLPVSEMLDMLQQTDRIATDSVSSRSALGVLQAASAENEALRREQEELRLRATAADRAARIARHRFRWAAGSAIFAATLVYLLLTLLVGALIEPAGGFARAFVVGFGEGWQVHAAVVAAVLAAAALVVGLRQLRAANAAALGTDPPASGPE